MARLKDWLLHANPAVIALTLVAAIAVCILVAALVAHSVERASYGDVMFESERFALVAVGDDGDGVRHASAVHYYEDTTTGNIYAAFGSDGSQSLTPLYDSATPMTRERFDETVSALNTE